MDGAPEPDQVQATQRATDQIPLILGTGRMFQALGTGGARQLQLEVSDSYNSRFSGRLWRAMIDGG
jgi:hypothetical protein